MAAKKKTEKATHYSFGATVRVLGTGGLHYVEIQQDRDGITVAHYYGPGSRARALAHARRLRAALKVSP